MASRAASGALLVISLLAAAGRAYDDLPFESVVDESSYLGQTPLRIWHSTRGYGQETAETAFGTHWATPTENGLAFVDGQMRVGNADQDFSVNFGGGIRWRQDDFFTGNPRIFGFSVWYDGEDTQLDNWFNQIGLSFERLGPRVDLRLNANIPLEDVKTGDNVRFTGQTGFVGNTIAQGTIVDADASLRVVDFEVAPRLFDLNAWFYAGGYQMDGGGVSELGRKGGVRGYLLNDLALDVGVRDDDHFGTTTVVQIIWTPGRVSATPSVWSHNIDDRMREHVYRNTYVAVTRTQVEGSVDLTDPLGNPFSIVHVNSAAAPGGDGTIANPFNTLAQVTNDTSVGDIILVHSDSTFTGESVTLQDAQRFLGEGDNQSHLITTAQLGQIALPESSAGASALAKPVINNAPGDAAILLAGGTSAVENLAGMEISNFAINGGTRGILSSPTGVGDVNINRMMISGTSGNGIELTPLVETLTNNTKRVRFRPTIDDVSFANIGGDDIRLDATTAEPGTTTISEAIVLSQITSTGGGGVGINLIETKRAATITDFNWNGGATGDGALRIQNTVSQGTVTMNGTNTITGGQLGTAFAISLVGGNANHVVSGTTITDMGGDSIVADGGVAGLTFTGRIVQNANDASILSVTGGHDGVMTFNELTTGQGVVSATMGDGLQLNNADGVYIFNHGVNLVGTSAGLNVVNGSDAVITLANATITNTTGTSVAFDGGLANLTFTGNITQTANDATVLSVTGGHDGNLVFNQFTAGAGVIDATMGNGLQFNNADGVYTFNHNVRLEGTSAAINVINGSDGVLTFADGTITNTTGTSINFNGGTANMSFTGLITQTANAQTLLNVANGHTGTLTFRELTAGTGVINATQGNGLQFNNADGAYNFNSLATFNGTSQAVNVENGSAGTFAFTNVDIDHANGAASAVRINGSAPQTFSMAGSIDTTAGRPVELTGNTGGSIVFSAGITATGASNGILVQNNSGGVNSFSGAVQLNTGGNAGVFINNNTGGSTSFSNLNITTGLGDGFAVNNSAGHAVTVTGANNNITTSGGTGLSMTTANVGGAGVNFRSVSTNGAVNGILLDTVTGGSVNIGGGAVNNGDGGTIQNSIFNAIDINNVAGFTLNRMIITGTNAAFDGIEIDHTSATVSNITISNTQIDDGFSGIAYNREASATSRLTLNNVTINNTAGVGLDIDVAGTADANISIINGTSVTNMNNLEAMTFNTTGGANKTVRLLIDGSEFTNNSAAAHTVNLNLAGTGTINANITDNAFNNGGGATGRAFVMSSNSPGTLVRLNLDNNNATSANANAYRLQESTGDFDIVDRATANARNAGGIEYDPNEAAFDDIPGPVPQPQ